MVHLTVITGEDPFAGGFFDLRTPGELAKL
jgi:hypothetical protein